MELPDRLELWPILMAGPWRIPWQLLLGDDEIRDILSFVGVYAAAATLSDEAARAIILQTAGRALIARISEQIGDTVLQP
jgi:hypothetical protein